MFLAIYVIIGLLIAAIPTSVLGWCVWRLTKGLPVWLRLHITLVITTFFVALVCTPIGGGEGGAAIPFGLIFLLHFHDLFGVGGADLREHILEQAVTFLCVWVGLYGLSALIIHICRFIGKRGPKDAAS